MSGFADRVRALGGLARASDQAGKQAGNQAGNQAGELAEARAQLDRQRGRIEELERELMRLTPQVAALEARTVELADRLDDSKYAASAAEEQEARSLVEEVRAEHARVRARISSATVFEERLRVIEERLGIDSLTGRDV